jgi:hypothetical protein
MIDTCDQARVDEEIIADLNELTKGFDEPPKLPDNDDEEAEDGPDEDEEDGPDEDEGEEEAPDEDPLGQ